MKFIDKDLYGHLPGVYKITNLKYPDRTYIGKADTLSSRYTEHLYSMKYPLKEGRGSRAIRQDVLHQSPDDFIFEVLAITPSGHIAWEIEQHFLRKDIKPYYNLQDAISGYPYPWASITPVIQYTLSGDFVRIFASLNEAGRHLKIDPESIRLAVGFRNRSAGGYAWNQYSNDPPMNITPTIPGHKNGSVWKDYWKHDYLIKEWSLKGEPLRTWTNIHKCLDDIGCSRGCFSAHLRGEYKTLKRKVYSLDNSTPNIPSNPRNFPVRQFDRSGTLIKIHDSASDAAKAVGCTTDFILYAAGMYEGHNGAKGYFWAYDDGSEFIPTLLNKNCKQILALDSNGNKLNQWTSILEFCRQLKVSNHVPYKLLKTGEIHNKLGFSLRYVLPGEPLV